MWRHFKIRIAHFLILYSVTSVTLFIFHDYCDHNGLQSKFKPKCLINSMLTLNPSLSKSLSSHKYMGILSSHENKDIERN
jgi:hypothetical protein